MRSDHNANPFTIHMVHQMRKAGIKVVMEIPTYPYDQEYIGFSSEITIYRSMFPSFLGQTIMRDRDFLRL